MKFCLLIEGTLSRIGLVRAKSSHPALWLLECSNLGSEGCISPCSFWGLLSGGPALAEVPGARLPDGIQEPAHPEQLCCLLPSRLLCSQHGRPCTNLRRFLFLAWHKAACYFMLSSCRANNSEVTNLISQLKLILTSGHQLHLRPPEFALPGSGMM